MRMPHPVDSEWWQPEVAVDRSDRGGAPTVAEPQVSDSPIPYWAMMTFLFLLFIAPQTFFPALVPFRIALLTAVLAMTTYVFDKVASGKPVMMRTREMGIAACLIAWTIVTVPFSLRPGESIAFLLETYGKTLAVFWLLSHTVNTLTRLRQVAWAVTLMTLPMTTTAVDNFISGTFIPGSDRIIGYEAPMTGNPNGLAVVLNLILPLSVALFLVTRRPVVRAGLLMILFLEVMAVILTFSRGGFLTLATTGILYLWRFHKRQEGRWAVVALVVALICIPLLPASYFDRLSTITDKDSDPTGSAQARWRDMVAAAYVVVQNPIVGVGLGMNAWALDEERGPALDVSGRNGLGVHNLYLVYAAELGIPGLVLFVMLFVGCMKSAMSVETRSAVVPALRELFYLAEGIRISLIAFAVSALFDSNAYDFYCYYFAGLAIAVRAAYEAESSHTLDQNQSAPRNLKPLIGLSKRELVYAAKQD